MRDDDVVYLVPITDDKGMESVAPFSDDVANYIVATCGLTGSQVRARMDPSVVEALARHANELGMPLDEYLEPKHLLKCHKETREAIEREQEQLYDLEWKAIQGLAEKVGTLEADLRRPAASATPEQLDERRLYTTEEAAMFLGSWGRSVTAATVRRWVAQGQLEGGWKKVAGGRRPQWLIGPRSLKRCVEGGLAEPGTYNNPENPDEQDERPRYLENLLHR